MPRQHLVLFVKTNTLLRPCQGAIWEEFVASRRVCHHNCTTGASSWKPRRQQAVQVLTRVETGGLAGTAATRQLGVGVCELGQGRARFRQERLAAVIQGGSRRTPGNDRPGAAPIRPRHPGSCRQRRFQSAHHRIRGSRGGRGVRAMAVLAGGTVQCHAGDAPGRRALAAESSQATSPPAGQRLARQWRFETNSTAPSAPVSHNKAFHRERSSPRPARHSIDPTTE